MASSVPSPLDCDPYADRRYARVPVALPAFLRANGERHAVQIPDLSPGGAKLDCPVSLPTGTAVILGCGTLGWSAVVRWQSAGVMGLCFDSELDAREASALIQRSEAMATRMKTREWRVRVRSIADISEFKEFPLPTAATPYGCVIATSSDLSLPFSIVRTLPAFGQ
jgi:hypothetical protein